MMGVHKIFTAMIGLLLIFVGTERTEALTMDLLVNGTFENSNSLLSWNPWHDVTLAEYGVDNHAALLGQTINKEGSSISQAFKIKSGYKDQTLSFDYEFAYKNTSPSKVDVFLMQFSQYDNLIASLHLDSVTADNSTWNSTGLLHYSKTFVPNLAPGWNYQLKFVLDENYTSYTDSKAYIDNAHFYVNVPEPGTLLLLGSGLLGMAAFGRRRFNK